MSKTWLQRQYIKKCRYCGSQKQLTKDHILPKAKGGKNSSKNYQILCYDCNQVKGNKTEVEFALILRDIKKRGVWYPWEVTYDNWLSTVEKKRTKNGLRKFN